jgi:TPP-dependent 2-oxoacid decarboxylase
MRIQSIDCLIFLGAFMTDIDFGISATPVDSENIINVTSEKLTIRHHTFDNVGLQAFISNLITADIRAREPQYLRNRNNGSPVSCFSAEICKKITVQCFFHRLASFITLDTIVIADTGDSLRCS